MTYQMRSEYATNIFPHVTPSPSKRRRKNEPKILLCPAVFSKATIYTTNKAIGIHILKV